MVYKMILFICFGIVRDGLLVSVISWSLSIIIWSSPANNSYIIVVALYMAVWYQIVVNNEEIENFIV